MAVKKIEKKTDFTTCELKTLCNRASAVISGITDDRLKRHFLTRFLIATQQLNAHYSQAIKVNPVVKSTAEKVSKKGCC